MGSIFAAWTTFGTFRMTGSSWSWRIPSVLQAVPSLLQVTLIWFCPESPRWLISKGKDDQAKLVLGKCHGNGDLAHPLVDYEYNEIKEAISMEAEVGSISWGALFSTAGNRRRIRIIIALAFFSQWSGNGLVSYYINLILESVDVTETNTKTLINGILQLFNLAMALTSALFVDRIGRRRLFLISNAGMLCIAMCWTVTTAVFQETGSAAAGKATIVMIFLFFGFYDIAYTPLLVAYTVEILPFRIRAKGFACMSFTVAVALIFNQYVNPVALERLRWKYFLFYVAMLIGELIFVWVYLLETKGRTLEQTAVLFDGEDAADHLLTEKAMQTPSSPTKRSSLGAIFFGAGGNYNSSADSMEDEKTPNVDIDIALIREPDIAHVEDRYGWEVGYERRRSRGGTNDWEGERRRTESRFSC